MNQDNKRKKFLKIVPEESKKNLQFVFLKLVSLTLIVTVIVLAVGLNIAMRIVLNTANLGRFAQAQFSGVFFWINWLSFLMAIISFVIGGLLALHFSHKIAGPLFRIETILKHSISNGKPPEIRIRKDDYMHELVGLLNEFVTKKIKE